MIGINETEIVQECRAIYQRFLDAYQEEQHQIVISRFGSFSQDLINRLSDSTEELMLSYGEKKQLVKRIFTILIEGLQNIKIHGEVDTDEQQPGFLLIAKNDNSYKVRFGNLCEPDTRDYLTQQVESLNRMTEEDVKKQYVNVLSNGILSEKGGAGLGFITMRLRSRKPLGYHFFPLADGRFVFTVEVIVAKDS